MHVIGAAQLEMRPPIHRTQLPAAERAMVEEMIKYKRQFEAVRDLSMHELGSFWLRKTHKVVMAVLLTRKGGADDRNVFWRGMNVEARSLVITPAHNKLANAPRCSLTHQCLPLALTLARYRCLPAPCAQSVTPSATPSRETRPSAAG